MRKVFIKTSEEALLYMISCTLATVSYMAGIKSKSKSEYKRQKDIAQWGIDFVRRNEISIPKGERAYDIMVNYEGSVDKWARQWE